MIRSPWYTALAVLVFCAPGLTEAGRGGRVPDGGAVAFTASERFEASARSSPSRSEPHFTPGKKSEGIQRVPTTPAAIPSTLRLEADRITVPLPDEPGADRFRKGVYHRYRPRDPTVAAFSQR